MSALLLLALALAPAAWSVSADPVDALAARYPDFHAEAIPAAGCKVKRCAGCWFKSKKPAEIDKQGRKTFLRFGFGYSEYPDAAAAAQAFELVKTDYADPDPYSKAPEYMRLEGARIYTLHGACLLAGKRWKKLLADVDAILGPTKPGAAGGCGCGTGCRMN